jgi:hypothetical protein
LGRRIELLGDLVQLTSSELLRIRNFGQTSLDEIIRLFRGVNLRLGIKLPDWQEKAGWPKVSNATGESETEIQTELRFVEPASERLVGRDVKIVSENHKTFMVLRVLQPSSGLLYLFAESCQTQCPGREN